FCSNVIEVKDPVVKDEAAAKALFREIPGYAFLIPLESTRGKIISLYVLFVNVETARQASEN
ncbi:hypothetical protein HK102_010577, partial [Quaeritorhiza haematococci]